MYKKWKKALAVMLAAVTLLAQLAVPVAYGAGSVPPGGRAQFEGTPGLPSLIYMTAAYSGDAGAYVAGGYYGNIARSADGLKWEPVGTYESDLFYYGSTYANGLFVLTGSKGTIKTSTDGRTWTQRVSGTTETISDVDYLNGKFVAVGNKGLVLQSDDGMTWTKSTIPLKANLGFDLYLTEITYGNGKYAVSYAASDSAILVSSDLVNWSKVQIKGGYEWTIINYVSFVNGKFIAGTSYGETLVSADAASASWPIMKLGGGVDAGAVFYNGKYVLINNKMYASSTGSAVPGEWTPVQTNSGNVLQGFAAGGGKLVAVGNDGIIVSSDGTNWRTAVGNFSGAAYGAGQYVAVGSAAGGGYAAVSPDFYHWEPVELNGVRELSDVIYTGTRFMALGRNAILTSPDGLSWSEVPGLPANSGLFTDVAMDGSTLVAVSDAGLIVTSADGGLNWEQRLQTADKPFGRVIFGGGKFVAVNSNEIYASVNGLSWTKVSPEVHPDTLFTDLVFANGKYYVYGSYYTSLDEEPWELYGPVNLASTDGVSWSPLTLSPVDQPITSVSYGPGGFLALTGAGAVSSEDGVNWIPENLPEGANLAKITLINNKFHLVGGGGAAYTAQLSGGTVEVRASVSSVSTKGFTLSLDKPVSGLTAADLVLGNGTVTVTGLQSDDGGSTYRVTAALQAGMTYPLQVNKTGYLFQVGDVAVPAPIQIAGTVSGADSTGFTLTLTPAVAGLEKEMIVLEGGPAVTDAVSADGGTTYRIHAAIQEGIAYPVKVTKEGYVFTVNEVRAPVQVTGTVSDAKPTGFTLTLTPAVDGLTAGDISLSGGAVVSDVVSSDGGRTYQVKAALEEGQTYRVTVVKEGYRFT
ncbi:hypothetical protein ACE6ED_27820, partial [Paenibacillus sp. CN-4]|uniref:hypothetical protein n=1 Tax=Paenibacillus nanchangensis TaxID=3348343 RepID=UPI00397DF72F